MIIIFIILILVLAIISSAIENTYYTITDKNIIDVKIEYKMPKKYIFNIIYKNGKTKIQTLTIGTYRFNKLFNIYKK